jgi:hypothetical protein
LVLVVLAELEQATLQTDQTQYLVQSHLLAVGAELTMMALVLVAVLVVVVQPTVLLVEQALLTKVLQVVQVHLAMA